ARGLVEGNPAEAVPVLVVIREADLRAGRLQVGFARRWRILGRCRAGGGEGGQRKRKRGGSGVWHVVNVLLGAGRLRPGDVRAAGRGCGQAVSASWMARATCASSR